MRSNLSAGQAVRSGRLIGVPSADFSGLRAIDGARGLAKALHPDAF
ncbi:hypothetical protein GT354_50380 [Streptomyces sp. SID3343]|nr:hypothetical protein [Streptomyces sp. SID3343]